MLKKMRIWWRVAPLILMMVMVMLLVMAMGSVMALVMVMVMQLVMAMEALVMVGVTEEPNRAYCSLSLAGFFTGSAFSHCISAACYCETPPCEEPLLCIASLARTGRA